jgi:hypothetical protein
VNAYSPRRDSFSSFTYARGLITGKHENAKKSPNSYRVYFGRVRSNVGGRRYRSISDHLKGKPMKPTQSDFAQYVALQGNAGPGYKSAIERLAPKAAETKKGAKKNDR